MKEGRGGAVRGVTINLIRDGLKATLAEQFPNTNVYDEESAQEFNPPCFFVQLLKLEQKQEQGRRYKVSYSFDVRFFPDVKKDRDLHHVAEQLYDALELVNINDQFYRGRGMKHKIKDGTLHFFVDYDFYVKRPKPEVPKMKLLEQEEYVHEQNRRN